MEALVFGIIALIALKKKQERIVPEPAEFQPFDCEPYVLACQCDLTANASISLNGRF
jgi:hypothetical protein